VSVIAITERGVITIVEVEERGSRIGIQACVGKRKYPRESSQSGVPGKTPGRSRAGCPESLRSETDPAAVGRMPPPSLDNGGGADGLLLKSRIRIVASALGACMTCRQVSPRRDPQQSRITKADGTDRCG